jgi:hypothetical protein
MSKIRNYLQKWRPLRMASPAPELDALGVERGPKFDKIVDQFFELQLRGKGKTPEDRTKILKNLAGIKDEPKKPEKKEKKRKGEKDAAAELKGRAKSKAAGVDADAAAAPATHGKIVSGKLTSGDAGRQVPASATKAQVKHGGAGHDTKAAHASGRATSKKASGRPAKKSTR